MAKLKFQAITVTTRCFTQHVVVHYVPYLTQYFKQEEEVFYVTNKINIKYVRTYKNHYKGMMSLYTAFEYLY